jgi:hypothetical protein
VAVATALVLAANAPARPQAAPLVGLGFSVTVSGGTRLGAPSVTDLESALIQAGFDDLWCDPDDPGCFGGHSTPSSDGGEVGYHVALGRSVAPGIEIRALYGREGSVRTEGVSLSPSRIGLEFTSRVHRYGLLVALRPGVSALRIAVGPALQSAAVDASVDSRHHSTRTERRLGFALEAGMTFPRRGPLFVDVSVLGWFGGDFEMGDYEVRDAFGALRGIVSDPSIGLSRSSLNLGVGVRL